MSTTTHEPERIAALDGVRGFAILFVLVMHSLFVAPLYGLDPMADPYARVAFLGWSGVDVFFVLSGFLITGILVRTKGSPRYFRNFYMRRSLRIFPLYYLVIALLLFVLPRPPATAGDQVAHLLYYQNLRYAFVHGEIIDPARHITWSLAIEEQFYLLWPALVWLVSTRVLRVVCVAMIVGAIGLRVWLVDAGFDGTHFLTPCRLDTLAAGALFAVIPRPGAWLGWLATPLGLAGLLTTGFVSGSSIPATPAQQSWGLLSALLLGVGMLSLARSSRVLQPLFGLWPLRSLGKYSYCIYLTHMLVVEQLTRLAIPQAAAPASWPEWLRQPVALLSAGLSSLPHALSPVWATVAFTALVVVCSWLLAWISWNLFERWFLALKRYFPSGA
jgi:peptidoglycan/LPS O-acetylase OafA/YrhL